MTDVLIESVSPLGNIQAIVEADDRVVHFYLHGSPDSEFGMRSVWVRNLVPATAELDVAGMKAGNPPMQPASQTKHPDGGLWPLSEMLRVVWLPEGNGAALYEGKEIIAIIPPWSGLKGFAGYARDAIGEGVLAWELDESNVLHERFADAERYWSLWDDEEFWPRTRDPLIGAIEREAGAHTNYYVIDGGEWPPKAMLRISRPDCTLLVTVGMSLLPQPNVDMITEEPEKVRRVELGVVLPKNWNDLAVKKFASYLSGQSALPWRQNTWLGAGHTIPCDSWDNPKFTLALLVSQHPAVTPIQLGKMLGDPISLLWFLPITSAERQIAMEQGTDSLIGQLQTNRWTES